MRERTPWAVTCCGDAGQVCNDGKLIYLTAKEYDEQMNHPNRTWRCPYCECEAVWSDTNHEDFYKERYAS